MNKEYNKFSGKLKEILDYNLTCRKTGKKLFQRKRVFTFENCIYSFLLNGVHGFSLGASHLMAMMYAENFLKN